MELDDVLKDELTAIKAKRSQTNPDDGDPAKNLFGIALSGGGIRSAILNLGILQVLNDFGILKRADYLSTVSGGGYIGGFVQAKLKKDPTYDSLFSSGEDIRSLKTAGRFLAPGRNLFRFFNILRFVGAFIFSLLMNWIWVVAVFLTVFFLLQTIGALIGKGVMNTLGLYLGITCTIVLFYHFFFHALRKSRLWSSNVLNYAEGVLVLLGTVLLVISIPESYYYKVSPLYSLLVSGGALFLIGFFSNPNILSLHRFYRDRIADGFLFPLGRKRHTFRMSELGNDATPGRWGIAPYPLINTCLNLLGEEDKSFWGTKASDYFLLSPLHCGSAITGYTRTGDSLYRKMSLSTALSISGAAISPNMGVGTNRVVGFLMALLNLKLGYWAQNPREQAFRVIWWPWYQLKELLLATNSKRSKVNISDGGHIENLAVFELLRRKCKLIIAVDAGEDAEYRFNDLANLVMRARNELGIEIAFAKDPEQVIRPLPSKGFSESHFVLARLSEMKGKSRKRGQYEGILLYIKSSLVAQRTWNPQNVYKTNHPRFPHEPTSDQFFDPAQWEAYHTLGRYIMADALEVDLRRKDKEAWKVANTSLDRLYDILDRQIRKKKK